MGSPYHVSEVASRHFPHDKSSAGYKALSLIAESLEHPQRTILSTFVQQAVDTEYASQFFLDEVSGQGKAAILEFLADWISLLKKVRPEICNDLDEPRKQIIWRRDGGQCCISKVQLKDNANESSTFVSILPRSLFEDCDMVSEGRLHKLLSAYVGGSRLKNLRSLMDHNSPSPNRNFSGQIMLLSPQVFHHFRNGRISLKASSSAAMDYSGRYLVKVYDFIPINRVEAPRFITLDHRATDLICLPNAQLLQVHQQFAGALAWLEVSEYMKQERHTPHPFKARNEANSFNKRMPAKETWSQWCLHSVSRTIQHLWIQLPVAFRAFIYKRLASVANRLYGYTGSDRTYRFPFNLYLRIAGSDWSSKHEAESRALQLVETYTQIPAPRAVDVIKYSDSSFLLMTGLPGKSVGIMLPTMTDQEVDAAAQDLKAYIAELRQIPNTTDSGFQICNALGGGILDWRIGDSQREELQFRNETEFNQHLTYDLPLTKDMWEKISKSHGVKHDIVFTHADLNLRNILVDEDMRISGVVDWECAGWYPEYWEYSKAHFGVRSTVRWIADVIEQAFVQYHDELQAEDLLASLTPPW